MSKWVVIHVFTWIMEVETIKLQTKATYVSVATGQSPTLQAWVVA